MNTPELFEIKRNIKSLPPLGNIRETVFEEIKKQSDLLRPGMKIAIAAGSRGIANNALIIRSIVDCLKELGCEPFIIPAMGSHGGGNAEGQKAVLEEYGITAESMGVEIISSMETVELPGEDLPCRAYMDKHAFESDGVIIVNKVKYHPDFQGETESGLTKMSVIGLGKHDQALEIHRFGVYGLKNLIRPTAEHVFKSGKILMGVAIVENAFCETSMIKAIRTADIMEEEKKLLQVYKSNAVRLPLRKIDILIVEQMGKNVCGSGLDTVLIGRKKIAGEEEYTDTEIGDIIVCRLTKETGGNALGMGLADYITEEFAKSINWKTTYENVVTSTFTERGKMPIVAADEAQALRWAIRTCGNIDKDNLKVVKIKDTSHLENMLVSKAAYDEMLRNGEDFCIVENNID